MNREKQIEEMAKEIELTQRNKVVSHCELPSADEYATALYEAGYRKQSEWISVEERLPEEEARVLVWLNIEDNYTTIDTDRILCGKWVRWNSFVTHWMPLPEPPKMEGGE